jgi:excisionase family DNA binding protein
MGKPSNSGARAGTRRVLSTGEAAAALGVHERTLRRYIAIGRLRYRRLPGGHYRIPLEAIDEFWVENDTVGLDGHRTALGARPAPHTRRAGQPRRPPLKREAVAYDLSPERLEELRAQYRTSGLPPQSPTPSARAADE